MLETMLDLVRSRAADHGDRIAYTFLVDGECDERHLTFGELERRARRVGALLQQIPGERERALLLYEPGLDYIVGLFGAQLGGWIPVPAYPPNPYRLARTLPRIQGILRDARPKVVLTTSSILPLARAMLAQLPEGTDVRVLSTDDAPEAGELDWRDPGLRGEDVAWLQYTSGSTASPKGVMVGHRNLLHNHALAEQAAGVGERLRMACWLPPYHDMGLVGGIAWPLYNAGHSTLMAPSHFLARPLRWLHAATRARANQIVGPNFAYKLCVRKVAPDELARIDLSSIEMAWNGAEPIHPEVLDQFVETFGPCGFRPERFYPCYGLAEATLLVSGGDRRAPPVIDEISIAALERGKASPPTRQGDRAVLVGCGNARPGTEIRIVDPEALVTLPERCVGEIWVASQSVAQGYWRQPEASEASFRARTAEGDGPLLRTGDLGYLAGRELFVTGRIKDLLIIRGRNLYPHDLEDTIAAASPAIRPGCIAVFPIEREGEEKLAIVAEVDPTAGAALEGHAIIRSLIERISAAHEVRPALVVLAKKGDVPKTPSGKLQRRLCKQLLGAGELDPIASWDERDGAL